MKSRRYTGAARARAAEATGERILQAAFARFSVDYYDQVTLDDIASAAGVTVQTVLRRFGSKENLVRVLTGSRATAVTAERDEAVAGDVAGAIANLVDHYEALGDLDMLLLRQEERVPPFAEITASGKEYHSRWIERVFTPWLDGRDGDARRRLLAQLASTCDVYVWYLLRRQHGLSREQTELALIEMVRGTLD
ncbi:TetR/AcrR family transcriptional regulator [Microbacterium sp. SD291]|uniref:TetR/AcrR family transcriptional regulator n=1 Tax=Microbacterium sp. SD291 TaxID=2782007 RepID=UPI001A957D82|nr:TetR/AcrR family transcriptional regulator [Microbacterium sp. SD291]MBO0980784.1 TetR/AcrR family transcriptional regulator [Microbacterium sp. SD291]